MTLKSRLAVARQLSSILVILLVFRLRDGFSDCAWKGDAGHRKFRLVAGGENWIVPTPRSRFKNPCVIFTERMCFIDTSVRALRRILADTAHSCHQSSGAWQNKWGSDLVLC